MLFHETDEFGRLVGGRHGAELGEGMTELGCRVEDGVETCQRRREGVAEWMGSAMFVGGSRGGKYVVHDGEQRWT